MKASKLFLLLGLFSLAGGVISCGNNSKGGNNPNPPDPGPEYTDPGELTRLQTLFNTLSSEYNFTFVSRNEANVLRTLNVFDKYCFYYSYQSTTKRGEYGMFFVEGQSTQDFHLDGDQVVVDFHEGPGKVELVENYMHDDYGDTFAHLPMSSLLGVDWTHFYKVDDDNYYTQDKTINRVFNYFTNEYYANWNDEYGGEEAYVNFSKSKTSFKFNEDGSVSITFLPKCKSSIGYSYNGSTLTISNIGSTSNQAISDYLAHPNPIVKKENYGFNEQEYLNKFGNVSIPFSDKFSGYISMVENYKSAAITVYDMCYEDGILEDIQNNLPNNWSYDAQESQALANEVGHTVYSYHSTSTITQVIEEQTVENEVDVYYSIALVSPSNKEPDKTLMPRGFFVGQIYRKLGEEAITGYEAISAYLNQVSNLDYLPDISRTEPYNPVLRDYTENTAIKQAFAAQGYYLYTYLQLDVDGISSGAAINLARNFKDDLNKLECYSNVDYNSTTYELSTTPDTTYFANKGEPLVQVMGSPIKNSSSEITGYRLVIIAYSIE